MFCAPESARGAKIQILSAMDSPLVHRFNQPIDVFVFIVLLLIEILLILLPYELIRHNLLTFNHLVPAKPQTTMMSDRNKTQENSSIKWPDGLAAERDMVYESLDLIHDQQANPDGSGDHMALIVSASRHSLFKDNDPRGVIHKVEATAVPNFATGKFEVTHEVCPGLNACSHIVNVNEKLKAACFDAGCVVPISNFGPKKTFNCDVRGRLTHHQSPVNCLAASSSGDQLASGCSGGQITLYQVREAQIEFLTRTNETSASFVTSMSYVRPSKAFSFGPRDAGMFNGETVLIYTTHDGLIGLLDTRCKLASAISAEIIIASQPRVNLSSMAVMNSLPGHVVYFGGVYGELFACDLRRCGQYIYEQKSTDVGCIRRMKEIQIRQNSNETITYLAHTTSSNKIKIIDLQTMKQSTSWKCDRLPEGRAKDLIQVGERIITCGEKTSIGCWQWSDPALPTTMS